MAGLTLVYIQKLYISRIKCELARTETSVAGSETGSGFRIETSLKVGSGSGVGSETNHSGSTALPLACQSTSEESAEILGTT
jgi:hypothetical protein